MANPSPAQLAARAKFKAMVQAKSKAAPAANSMGATAPIKKATGLHTNHSSTNMTGSTKMMPGQKGY